MKQNLNYASESEQLQHRKAIFEQVDLSVSDIQSSNMKEFVQHKVHSIGEWAAGALASGSMFIWITSVVGWVNEYYHVVAVASGMVSILWYIRKYIQEKLPYWKMKRMLKKRTKLGFKNKQIENNNGRVRKFFTRKKP